MTTGRLAGVVAWMEIVSSNIMIMIMIMKMMMMMLLVMMMDPYDSADVFMMSLMKTMRMKKP